MNHLPRSIQFKLFQFNIWFQTAKQLFEIRKAYGMFRYLYQRIVAAVVTLCLFLLFGFIFIQRFQGGANSGVLASVQMEEKGKPAAIAKEERILKTAIDLGKTAETYFPYAFLVDKKKKRLTVYSRTGDSWKEADRFQAVIGENEGRKVVEGDKRTPEGLYWIVGERPTAELDTVVYGRRAFVLNYPNRFDIQEGRSGSGIWIHGTDRPVSRGCIALSKNDLVRLEKYAVQGIPVYISADAGDRDFESLVDFQTLQADRDSAFTSQARLKESLYEFVRNWGTAWENTDIDRYKTFYSPHNFLSRDMNYEQWISYKRPIFDRLRGQIRVEVSDFIIRELSDQKADVLFRQFYGTSSTGDSTTKNLRIVRENGAWKILWEGVVTN